LLTALNMALQMGLRDSAYWGVNYFYNAMLYMVVFLLVAILSFSFKLRFFTQTRFVRSFARLCTARWRVTRSLTHMHALSLA